MSEKKGPGRPNGSTGTRMKTFTVALPPDKYSLLVALAKKDGYKTAQLARFLIEKGLAKNS